MVSIKEAGRTGNKGRIASDAIINFFVNREQYEDQDLEKYKIKTELKLFKDTIKKSIDDTDREMRKIRGLL